MTSQESQCLRQKCQRLWPSLWSLPNCGNYCGVYRGVSLPEEVHKYIWYYITRKIHPSTDCIDLETIDKRYFLSFGERE